MGTTVTLDTSLFKIARTYSLVEHRSIPKQIEHWARIGRIAEENPDLDYNDIKNILLGLQDIKVGAVEEYIEGCL